MGSYDIQKARAVERLQNVSRHSHSLMVEFRTEKGESPRLSICDSDLDCFLIPIFIQYLVSSGIGKVIELCALTWDHSMYKTSSHSCSIILAHVSPLFYTLTGHGLCRLHSSLLTDTILGPPGQLHLRSAPLVTALPSACRRPGALDSCASTTRSPDSVPSAASTRTSAEAGAFLILHAGLSLFSCSP